MRCNKHPIKLIISFMGCISALIGCQESTPVSMSPHHAEIEVGVDTVKAHSVMIKNTLAGRAVAHAAAEIRPQVSGIISKRYFIEGTNVQAGQPLYQIEPLPFQAAYKNAQANLAKAKAQATLTRLKAERYKTLVAVEAVSQQEYDEAVAAMQQSTAEVLAAQAAVDIARINLDFTQVKCPINGRIGRSAVTQGALVTAGQGTPLAIVQQLDPIYVDIKQSSAAYVRLRQKIDAGLLQQDRASSQVKLTLEEGSAYPLSGTLQLADINLDAANAAVTMRAIFPNPKGLLLPGAFVRATLQEGINSQAILLPQQALMRNPKGEPYVFVVGKHNRVEMRPINTGDAIENQWIVQAGLNIGDSVIVSGLQKVRPGARVKPILVKTVATTQHATSQIDRNRRTVQNLPLTIAAASLQKSSVVKSS